MELTEDSNMTLGEWLDKWLAEYICEEKLAEMIKQKNAEIDAEK